jgi:hypothetical protein
MITQAPNNVFSALLFICLAAALSAAVNYYVNQKLKSKE